MQSSRLRQHNKIQAILEWADDQKKFDSRFVESLEDQLEKRGSLSPRQEEALDNIITRFKIPER